MKLTEFRQQYPQYDDLSDKDLSDALYRAHYSDMLRSEFDAALGISTEQSIIGRAKETGARILGNLADTVADAIPGMPYRSVTDRIQPSPDAATAGTDNPVAGPMRADAEHSLQSALRANPALAERLAQDDSSIGRVAGQVAEQNRRRATGDALPHTTEDVRADIEQRTLPQLEESGFDGLLSANIPTSTLPDNDRSVRERFADARVAAGRQAAIDARRADENIDAAGKVGRYGLSAASSLGNMFGSGFKYLGLKSGADSLVSIGQQMQDVAAARTPKDQTLDEEVVGGLASIGGSLLTAAPLAGLAGSSAVASALKVVGATMPRLAAGLEAALSWSPAIAAGAFEAAGNATETYDNVLRKTGSKSLAEERADKTFAANAVWNSVLDKFGIFGENRKIATRIVLSGSFEGVQEGSQRAIGNYYSGDPVGRGVTHDALIGALSGAGAKAIMAPFERNEQTQGGRPVTPADILNASDIESAIAASNAVVDASLQPEDEFSAFLKQEQSDLAYLRRDTQQDQQKEQDLQAMQRGDLSAQADIQQAISQANDQVRQPTAIELAMQQAREKADAKDSNGLLMSEKADLSNRRAQIKGAANASTTTQVADAALPAQSLAQGGAQLAGSGPVASGDVDALAGRDVQPAELLARSGLGGMAAGATEPDALEQYIRQREDGRWTLKLPPPIALRDAVIAEIDRRNAQPTNQGEANGLQVQGQEAAETVKQQPADVPGAQTVTAPSQGEASQTEQAKPLPEVVGSNRPVTQPEAQPVAPEDSIDVAKRAQTVTAGLNGVTKAGVGDTVKSVERIRGKLAITGFTADEIRDASGKLRVDIRVGQDGKALVSVIGRSGNAGIFTKTQERALREALLGKDVSQANRRKITGNLRNDLNALHPGLYAEIERGGDGEATGRFDLGAVAEELRDEYGYAQIPQGDAKDAGEALIGMIRQGGAVNEDRMLAEKQADEARRERDEIDQLAAEYGVETRKGILRRNQATVAAELMAAIEHEIGVAGNGAAAAREAAASAGMTEAEISAIEDRIADEYFGDPAKDAMVRMYRAITNELQGAIDARIGLEEGGQDGARPGEGARAGEEARGAREERPDFTLERQTEAELNAKAARENDQALVDRETADQQREAFNLSRPEGSAAPKAAPIQQAGLFTATGQASQAAAQTPADAGVSVSGPDMAQWEMDFGIMGKYTYEPANRAPIPNGGKLIASQIIPKKIKVSNRFSTDYEVPREIHAFRVSVVERSNGARYSQVEYMKRDTRQGDKVVATFEKMPQDAIETREYSSINNAAVKMFEANKPVAAGDMFADKGTTEKTVAEMSPSDLLRAAADKMDAEKKAAEKSGAGGTVNEPVGEIEDFGEKLGGAKKDMAADLRDAVSRELSDDEIASMPLSKIWPKESIDQIEDPFIAAVAHAARAEIPSKPRQPYKVRGWVEKVKTLRGMAATMLRGGIGRDFMEKYVKEHRGLEHFYTKVQLLESIDRQNWGRIGYVQEWPDSYTYAADGKTQIPTPLVLVEIDGKRKRYDASSVADVLDKVRDALGEAPQAKKMEFEVRGRDGAYFINKKGDPLYRKLKTFETTKEAFDYRASHYDDLVSAWEAVKDRDNVKETDVRLAENRPRSAQDWRDGKDVTPEQFADEFGFRGVEFGNYVGQGKNAKERQGMLNQAYDALMDLSDIVGVPPKAISLNGTLGLGFGSRGSGWASAHFEPDMLVINLTKTRGAGTLAHEWFHALDNYFQRQRGEPAGAKREDYYITYAPENYYVHKQSGFKLPVRAFNKMIDGERVEGYGTIAQRYRDRSQWELKEGVRPEVGETFAALVKALNDSPMAGRASLIDKGKSGGYWSRIIERGARSFESYVIHKMMLKGYHNDYLANVTSIEEFSRDPGRYPYLLEGEIQPVAEAFDNLFATIQTKETDKGVAMFSRKNVGAGESDTAFSFAGERAQTADQHALSTAQSRLEAGDDAESVRQETGWFVGNDGKWRFEIDDSDARFIGVRPGRNAYVRDVFSTALGDDGVFLGDVLHHPALFSAYPWLAETRVDAVPQVALGEARASYRDGVIWLAEDLDASSGLSSLLHEIQHGIQSIEGFATGWDSSGPYLPGMRDKVIASNLDSLRRGNVHDPSNPFSSPENLLTDDEMREMAKRNADDLSLRYDVYRRVSGEVEARNTQTRRSMTADQRRTIPPIQTADVADADVIVVWNGKEMESRITDTQPDLIHQEDLSAVVKRARQTFPGIQINMIDDESQAPKSLRDQIEAADAVGDVAGAYHEGELYVIRSGIRDIEHAENTVVHEATHGGLRRLFGEQLHPVMLDIHKSNLKVRAKAFELSKKYGYSTVRSTEEVLADMGPEVKKLKGWDRLVAWVRDKLRRFGFVKDWTDNDVEALVLRALEAVKKPAGTHITRGTMFARNAQAGNSVSAPENTRIIGDSGRNHTTEQRAMFRNVGREVDVKTTLQSLREWWGQRWQQGIFDQFQPVKAITEKGYTLLRLSKGATGAFEAFMNHGKLSLRDGAYDADTSGGVMREVFFPLGKETTDFLYWIAGNRAERLADEGKERLFSAEDIVAAKSLADGKLDFDYVLANGKATRVRALAYSDSLRKFNEFNKNVLDMAEQSGLIDGDSRKLWEHEFYVPFYRVNEDDGGVRGMNIKQGVVRQQAFKKLKGGKEGLNDLLANTLMNWAHLIDAAAKNRAAKETLEAAERIGAASKAMAGEKHTVWYMDGGKKIEYAVDDAGLLDALNGLEYSGLRGPIMDLLAKPKHWLTIGVTASPFFKVRNLIRDSIQAIGVSDLSYNAIGNVIEGYKLTNKERQEYVSALAGGGLIRFGTMLEGNEAARTRQLIKKGAKDEHILDSESKLRAFYDKWLEPGIAAYNEIGNRGEEINRMSLYDQLIKQGVDHATASLMARDLMDFSLQGSWTTVRFLAQTVPFFNARLQGMYKLGRATKTHKAKMATVIGAAALMSLALLTWYGDDDDWKKREDWDRDNYWWFKFGGTAFRIPKPFEIGAAATLVERTAEMIFDKEMTGKRFRQVVTKLLADQLAMNPIPQLAKPIVDIYANKDSFTGRPIESMSMERLDPQYRYNANTSMPARYASKAMMGALSPVQIDHLVRGYFAWMGASAVTAADMAIRAVNDEPTKPALDYWKWSTGGMVAELDSAGSRYVSTMYDQAKELEAAYSTWRQLRKEGKNAEAAAYRKENAGKLQRYRSVEDIKKRVASINERIRMIERSSKDADAKKAEINYWRRQQDKLARRIAAGD